MAEMTENPFYIFDGISDPIKLRLTRKNTGLHYFKVWYVDWQGQPLEPYDLTGYTFRMQVKKNPKDEQVVIDVVTEFFTVDTSYRAGEWEAEHEDPEGRADLLTITIPKDLTEIPSGLYHYDITFFPPNGQRFTYAQGPYEVNRNVTEVNV